MAAGNKPKRIEEYVGRVSSGQENVSVARMISPGGWEEPAQRPEFDEISVVLLGTLRVTTEEGVIDVRTGQAVMAHAGEQFDTARLATTGPSMSPFASRRSRRKRSIGWTTGRQVDN